MATNYYQAWVQIYMKLDQDLRRQLLTVTREALKGDFEIQRKALILQQIEEKITGAHVALTSIENEALTAFWHDQQSITRGQIAALGKYDSDSALFAAADPSTWAAVDHGAISAIARDMANARASFLGMIPNAVPHQHGGILRQVSDYLRALGGEEIPKAFAGESIYNVGRNIREGGINAMREGRGLQNLADGIDAALGVTYADGSIHSLHAYGQMAARTGVMRARTEATFSEFQQYGIHAFQVSTHGTLCYICRPMEGTVWALDEEGIRQGYQYSPMQLPYHPCCAHLALAWLGIPSEGTPATPPDAAFGTRKDKYEWMQENHPQLLKAAGQGFGTEGEWNHAVKALHDKRGIDTSELRGPRYRYADIESRRQKATALMLDTPGLAYKDAMGKMTEIYMQTPEYAKLRAKSGIYSPTRQRKIVDLANHGMDISIKIPKKSSSGKQPIGEVKFQAASTPKDAEKWAVENGLARNASYKNIHIDAANAMNEGIHTARSKFSLPEMEFIGSAQDRNQYFIEKELQKTIAKYGAYWTSSGLDPEKEARKLLHIKIGPTCLAQSVTDTRINGISYNEKYFSKSQFFNTKDDILPKNVAEKFHPIGCDTAKSIIDHEMGHQIHDIIPDEAKREIEQEYDRLSFSEIKSGLSEYAALNVREFVAESWSEYWNNPTPRTIAKKVSEILLRYQN